MAQTVNSGVPVIAVDSSLCKVCGACLAACPPNIFVQKDKGEAPNVVDPERCMFCGQCVAICPYGQSPTRHFPRVNIPPLIRKPCPPSKRFSKWYVARRSVRHFQNKAVEREKLEKIVEAARYAPTGSNKQLNEYTVVTDPNLLNKIRELFKVELTELLGKLDKIASDGKADAQAKAALANFPVVNLKRNLSRIQAGRDPLLNNAPAVMLFHTLGNIPSGDANCNLALQNASLMVEALGLGAYYTGNLASSCRRSRLIPDLLGMPKNNKVYGGLAIGHPRFKYVNWITRKPAKVTWL